MGIFADPQSAGTESGEKIVYNTAGDDSANYVDGDTSGRKSEWVKDGDTWTYTFYVDDPNAQWYIWEDSETLMEGYAGDYTESNIGNLFTTEILNEFNPESYMDSKTDSNGKTVYTWLDSEKAYKVTDNGDGTYTKVSTALSFTITNTKQGVEVPTAEKGSLTISKIVKDSEGNTQTANDDDTNFKFTITLSATSTNNELIEGTKVFGNVVFKNKIATVALKAGNSITIPDLPAGVSYIIAESEYTDYTVSYENQRGTIAQDTESRATITNTKKEVPKNNPISGPDTTPGVAAPEQKYVDITIKKAVIGNNEINEEYTIEVELNNLIENTEYELSDGTKFYSNAQGTANISLKLSNNDSISLKDIPVGAKYKAFEYAGDYISSYVITDSNNKGLISSTANRNAKTNQAISTATETADEDENVTITFTNKRIVTQNLKLTKTVTDNEDTNEYMFDIEFGEMEEGTAFNSTAGRVIAEDNGKAELSVYLTKDESVEFYDIPVGTTYRVKELASSSIASYTITDSNGLNQIAKASNSNTKAKKALSTEIETVNQGENVTINFINNTVNQEPDSVEVSLGVTKNVQNKAGEIIENCNDSFDFELNSNGDNPQDNEDYPMPEKTNAKITGNGTESFGTITFSKTGTYTYKITEKSGNNTDYEYDNSEYIVTFEVTNPEGLLEVNKTIKKDGFNSDAIVFTNKTDKYEPKPDPEPETEPDTKEEPENPNNSENIDEPSEPKNTDNIAKTEENDNNNKIEEKKNQKENKEFPKTGQTRAIYIALGMVILISAAGVVVIRIKNKKN